MSFQCKDGGWAAFDKDVSRRWLEDVPLPTTTRSSIPRAATSPAACWSCLAKSLSAQRQARAPRHRAHPAHAGFRRLVVMAAGASITSTARADSARPPLHRRRHAPAVDHPRRATGWRAARTKTAAGARLHELRRPDIERPRPKHTVADRVGAHGHHLRDRFERGPPRSTARGIRRGIDYLISQQSPTAHGPNPRRPHRIPMRVLSQVRYVPNNWPLMALAHYATATGALKRE